MTTFSRAVATAGGGPRYIRFTGDVWSDGHRDGRESNNSRVLHDCDRGRGVVSYTVTKIFSVPSFVISRSMVGMAGLAGMGAAQAASASTGPDLKTWDTDHDGTMDLTEAKRAAEAKFDRLDSDHDGTIDRKESVGAIGKATFAKGDVDKDGTLDKSEYLNLVEARFNAADTDHDGTVSESELNTPAGKALARLL
jgi:hypothetical protein